MSLNKTNIEWCDFTWNPVTGCLGPAGDGVRCSYCYAHRLAKVWLKPTYLRHPLIGMWGAGDPDDPFAPRWAGGLLDPMGKKPSRIFVCSMGDLFGDWMPDEWIERVLTTVKCCPQHTFMFLTKWPQNLARWNPWPDNAWLGATATDVWTYLQAEAGLVRVKAPVRFISFEPLLERIGSENFLLPRTDWIIVGAQTGPGAKPVDREAVQELILAADERHIPVFLKDNLKWPEKRQEWPKVGA